MVILHVRVDDVGHDEFLVQTRCAEQTGLVVAAVAELYALRVQLREMLAMHDAPPADSVQLLSEAAVRQKRLIDAHTLAQHTQRLGADLAQQGAAAPSAPPAREACAALVFAKKELPRDETPLSAFCGTNEKSKLTLTLIPSALIRERASLARAQTHAPSGAPAACDEVSLLAFVSKQADTGRALGHGGADADARRAKPDDDDEDRPRLSSEHIERLWASRKVCGALRSASLQEALVRIDSSVHPERELDKAMMDEHFAAFVHEMLVEMGAQEPTE
jgi:hypothetical protein